MTDLAQSSATPPKRKGSKIMWVISGILAVIAVAAIVTTVIGFQMKLEKPVLIGMLTVVGLSLEGLMWTVAASIGVTVFETRKRIWRFLTGRGWTQG